MFSSLTQFLPASLQHQNEERAKQNAQAVQEAEDEGEGEEEPVPEEEATSVKSKKKDRKANEVCGISTLARAQVYAYTRHSSSCAHRHPRPTIH